MTCFSLIRRRAPALLFFLLTASLPTAIYADPTFDKFIADKKYKEALDYAETNLPTSQRDAAVWVQMAQANDALGIQEKALACYLVASRLSQDNYAALLGAATIYNKLNQPEEAIEPRKKGARQEFHRRGVVAVCTGLHCPEPVGGSQGRPGKGDPGRSRQSHRQ